MLALVLVLFFVWPFEKTTYLNMPELMLGGLAGGRYTLVDEWLDPKTLRNDSRVHHALTDLTYGETFSYGALVDRYSDCSPEVVFKGPNVAVIAYCDIVFVTTADLVIRHVVTRATFMSHREDILDGCSAP